MADRYVTTTGNDANAGNGWGDGAAKRNLTGTSGALNALAAGEAVYIASGYTAATAFSANATVTLAAYNVAPNLIIATTDQTNEPPTSEGAVTRAEFLQPNAGRLNFNGHGTLKNITVKNGSGTGAGQDIVLGNSTSNRSKLLFDATRIELLANSTTQCDLCLGPSMTAGSVSHDIDLYNCEIKFANAGQRVRSRYARVQMVNCSVDAASPAMSGLFLLEAHTSVTAIGCDFTAIDGAANTLVTSIADNARIKVVGCKLHANTTALCVSVSTMGGEAIFLDCDVVDAGGAGIIGVRSEMHQREGTVMSDTTVARVGGARHVRNGAEFPFSWRYSANANTSRSDWLDACEHPLTRFSGAVGSPVTVTAHLCHFGSAKLTDIGVEMDVLTPTVSGDPKYGLVSTRQSRLKTTGTDLATSTEQWDDAAPAYNPATNYVVGDIVRPTTKNGAIYQCVTDAGTTAAEPTWGTTDGGITTDAAGREWRRCWRQKIECSITPQEEGLILAFVRCCVANLQFWVDPAISVA